MISNLIWKLPNWRIKWILLDLTVRYNLINFIKNAWLFRKELTKFEPFDYACNLDILKRSLELTVIDMKYYEKYGYCKETIAELNKAIELLTIMMDEDNLDIIKENQVWQEFTKLLCTRMRSWWI